MHAVGVKIKVGRLKERRGCSWQKIGKHAFLSGFKRALESAIKRKTSRQRVNELVKKAMPCNLLVGLWIE